MLFKRKKLENYSSLKPVKEPSLFRKLVEIHYSQAMQRREIRRLSKMEWSFDFLCAMLVRCGKALGQNIQLEIVNKDNQRIILTYQDAAKSTALDNFDNNIFNKLDDREAVAKFIRENSVR